MSKLTIQLTEEEVAVVCCAFAFAVLKIQETEKTLLSGGTMTGNISFTSPDGTRKHVDFTRAEIDRLAKEIAKQAGMGLEGT